MRGIRAGLLRHHDFRQLFIADVFGQVSTQIVTVALPLVAILVLSATEFEVGLLAACATVAFLVIGLPAGAWVDRMRRRNVLITADFGRALVLASIPLANWLGLLTIWQMYVAALVFGVLTVFFDVAYQSYLPFLVGRDRIVEGNSKLEAVRATSQLGGPSLAGGLVQVASAPAALIGGVGAFLGSAFWLGLIREREPKPDRIDGRHLGREVLEGLRFVLGNRLLASIAGCTASFNLLFSAIAAMEMIFLVRILGLSPGMAGLFLSVMAGGGLVGAVVVGPVVRLLGQGPSIWISTAATTPFALLLPMAQPGWRTWVAAGGMFVLAIGSVVYNVTQVSFRQSITPDRLLGRMNATMRFLVWGTLPLGGLLGGVLGSAFGARTTLWIATIGACFTFLPTFLSPLRRMRELPTAVAESA